jgi:hypothetical protein
LTAGYGGGSRDGRAAELRSKPGWNWAQIRIVNGSAATYLPRVMIGFNHPARDAFCAAIRSELVLGQVLVRRLATGFELRHGADEKSGADALRRVSLNELRGLANHTAGGEFRPIKAAPNLRAGWVCQVASDAELESALNQLYPGALADWFAVQAAERGALPRIPVTDYREFTARQTGMYRITTKLTDAQAAQVTRACCEARFCLKRRFWSVPGLAPDTASAKSLIPCLEPCAVMLEFARKAARLEQEEAKPTVTLAPSEIASLLAALEIAVAHPPANVRAADLAAADNPLRLQLLREKLQGFAPVAAPSAEE